jgi:two-component system phosphate regulon sensor histidine kinase PhoR
MFWRFSLFLLAQVVPAGVGWFLLPAAYQVIGACGLALFGSYLWFVWDALRGTKVLAWLRSGNTADLALGGGLWGEVLDRIRKLVRARDRALVESDGRLQDILAALQASPNGVVLLDADGRIEWFNQTAASHFGFDPQRDLLQHVGNLVRDPGFVNYWTARDFRAFQF